MGEVVEVVEQETPLEKFRRSAGFQINFVLHSGLEVGRAIDHLCVVAEKLVAASREWQPIETAPKEITHKSGSYEYGRTVLVFDGNILTACWWQCRKKDGALYGSNWVDNGANALHPTHWMPLPDPPTTD